MSQKIEMQIEKGIEQVNDAEVIKHLTSGKALIEGGLSQFNTIDGSISSIDLKSVDLKLKGEKISILSAMIMEGVYSFYNKWLSVKQGPVIFTPLEIYQEITKDYSRRPSPKKLARIQDEIDRLAGTRFILNTTEEYRKLHKIGDFQVKNIEGAFLNVTKITLVHANNGREYVAYRLEQAMLLYEYAEQTNKIVSYPTALLLTLNPLNYTDDMIYIQRYIVREISKTQEERLEILYEGDNGMFTEFGYGPDESKDWISKRRNLRKLVIEVVDSLKSAEIISGYEEFRQNDSKKKTDPYIGLRIQK